MPRRIKPIERLMIALDRYATMRGEAQWTNGYRAAKGEPEESRLYPTEMAQLDRACGERFRFRRLAMRLLREAADD